LKFTHAKHLFTSDREKIVKYQKLYFRWVLLPFIILYQNCPPFISVLTKFDLDGPRVLPFNIIPERAAFNPNWHLPLKIESISYKKNYLHDNE